MSHPPALSISNTVLSLYVGVMINVMTRKVRSMKALRNRHAKKYIA